MNKVTIDRDLGSPLHHQVYLVLADGIATGRYAIGEKLPTEEQLTQLFSVSRITVRRAMTSLHNDGLIERGAGRRTTVRHQLGQPLKVRAASMIENIAAYGAETVATVLEFDYVPAPGFLRDRLWQAEDQPVQRAVRVRRQDDEPVMYLTSYVPGALGRTFTADELNRIPMFQLLGRAGAHISGGEKIVSATLAEPLVAGRLEIKVGSPLLEVRSMMIDRQGRAVEYIEMLAIPDRLKLRIQVGAEQAMPLPDFTKVKSSQKKVGVKRRK
jgi:GntR family transcriptional regulator